jgi:hypothetical protein
MKSGKGLSPNPTVKQTAVKFRNLPPCGWRWDQDFITEDTECRERRGDIVRHGFSFNMGSDYQLFSPTATLTLYASEFSSPRRD